MLVFNALIVAGGRSSRLGGVPKALLSNGQQTLLASTLDAAGAAAARVVVGPSDLPLPSGVLLTREEPAFSGPAAAISAGLDALAQHHAPWTLLLSVDIPQVAGAVERLTNAAVSAAPETMGFWGVADGTFQPLLGIYRTDQLAQVFAGDTANASVRRFLAPLSPQPVQLASELTADVDTWQQAQASGYTRDTSTAPSA